jgi:hypothetical protein
MRTRKPAASFCRVQSAEEREKYTRKVFSTLGKVVLVSVHVDFLEAAAAAARV